MTAVRRFTHASSQPLGAGMLRGSVTAPAECRTEAKGRPPQGAEASAGAEQTTVRKLPDGLLFSRERATETADRAAGVPALPTWTTIARDSHPLKLWIVAAFMRASPIQNPSLRLFLSLRLSPKTWAARAAKDRDLPQPAGPRARRYPVAVRVEGLLVEVLLGGFLDLGGEVLVLRLAAGAERVVLAAEPAAGEEVGRRRAGPRGPRHGDVTRQSGPRPQHPGDQRADVRLRPDLGGRDAPAGQGLGLAEEVVVVLRPEADRTASYDCTPGIQLVPARGTFAIAAASTVSATRSSRSRLWTFDLPQARASVVSSSTITVR